MWLLLDCLHAQILPNDGANRAQIASVSLVYGLLTHSQGICL